MNKYYQEFLQNISLTSNQIEDGRKKYKGVCDCLAMAFFNRHLQDDDKLVFGSFKNKTQVLPMGTSQDVDVVFKISKDIYESYKRRPGDILQKVRTILKNKYTTTDHISAWGKVVLVDFAENYHDVEVAPCFETDEGVFLIPNNYSNEVDWEPFDVRGQLESFSESNKQSNGLTRNLVKIIKKWVRNTPSLSYSSFNITNDVIYFVGVFYKNGLGNSRYDIVVKDFFTYIYRNTPSYLSPFVSNIQTAQNRAVKANQYFEDGLYIEATSECIKLFGNEFPKANTNIKRENECDIVIPVKPWAQN